MFGEQIVTRVTISRPTETPVVTYTEGDVISNSKTATTLLEFDCNADTGGSGYITKVQLKTDNPLFLSQCRLWIFKASSYSVAADNAAMNVSFAGDEVGYIDIPVMEAVGTACAMAVWTGTYAYKGANNAKLYGVLQFKTGTATPVSSQQFSVELTCERN